MTRRLLGLLLIAFALTGGCANQTPAGPAAPALEVVAPASAAVPKPLPTRLVIPAIGVDEQLAFTGLNADNTVEVPPVTSPEIPSWYSASPPPGQPGPAVLLGHVNGTRDGRHVPGVFARLDQLQVGDEIRVDRQGLAAAVFEVYATEQPAKNAFPTARVYGDTTGPELRLITCGGVFDPAARSYVDNVIVYARARA